MKIKFKNGSTIKVKKSKNELQGKSLEHIYFLGMDFAKTKDYTVFKANTDKSKVEDV